MPHVLGIDLGGTKVLAAVIDTDKGRVLSTVKKRSRGEHSSEDLQGRLLDAAQEAISESGIPVREIRRAGIGVAGQIDHQRGIVVAAPNLAGMKNVKLADLVEKKLSMPTFLFNDVEAAAAGEAAFGAGKGQRDFVVVFVGTGIGGAIYRDGRPYGGATQTAGELGHMTVDVDGRLCGCGQFGHLEAYASRTAIVRAILAGLKAGRHSVLSEVATEIDPGDPGGSGIRSKAIHRAVEDGDGLTTDVLQLAAHYLSAGLASIVNFYNPPLIILGGGLVEAVDVFYEAVATGTRKLALQVPAGHVEVVRTGLGDNSGVVGAAVLAAAR